MMTAAVRIVIAVTVMIYCRVRVTISVCLGSHGALGPNSGPS